ncbi:hypothetical protein FS749_010175 [Ceratobasidium sp. UAMH 11750]|nr:hypothetical protein FS749_010175 [Ceratobasidium sp. UAMH 11750]
MKDQRDKQRSKSARSGVDFLQKLRQQMPERLFNPALFIPDLDANQDTPVEILHVVLLGIVKYFWRDAVARQTTEGKEILKARIDSLDVTGLGLDALRGTTLVQYAKSLYGRDFRAILQIGALVLYGLVSPPTYKAWLALSRLGPLVFQQEIDDVDKYVLDLSRSIDALLEATALWTPQWFNKLKFHILLHLPQHILRFGPAILFATETFESYNFVIRLRSIHSNRHAPSHDISRAFLRMYVVRHLVSGGWVTHIIDKSSKLLVRATPRQAGPTVLSLRNDHVFTSLMGMSSFNHTSSYGNFIRQAPLLIQPWACTVASHCVKPPAALAPNPTVTMCERVVLKNNDVARRSAYVLIAHQGTHSPGQVLEILATHQRVLGLTIQMASLLPDVDTYQMPGIRLRQENVFVSLDDVLCCLSIYHNCAQNGCTVSQTKVIRQERQRTNLLGLEIQHRGDLFDSVVNFSSLRSAPLVQPLRSPLPPPSDLILGIAQRAVSIWQANEVKERTEKAKKEEKDRRAAEREQKKQEQAEKREQKGVGTSGKGKRKREDEEPAQGGTSQAQFDVH